MGISFGGHFQLALVKKDAILCCAPERQVLRLLWCEKQGSVGIVTFEGDCLARFTYEALLLDDMNFDVRGDLK